ncbi:hypothetical protein CVT26_005842 [Gymnopilus dilepis]|uniref:Uncharacterized protein n=1 Tax=Gymnopilus dilepis TaxID=231916 RepID=A0A409VNW4_9AGAR|nr:hypothetical protein CVT26_005842 [Gymnopilus dilepis]
MGRQQPQHPGPPEGTSPAGQVGFVSEQISQTGMVCGAALEQATRKAAARIENTGFILSNNTA